MTEAENTYAVGYKRPPVHSRFTKGVCPNPSGRPKKGQSPSCEYDRELRRKHRVAIGGKIEKLTSSGVILKQLIKLAMSGNLHAIKLILPIMDASEARKQSLENAAATKKARRIRPDYSHFSSDEIRAKLEEKLRETWGSDAQA